MSERALMPAVLVQTFGALDGVAHDDISRFAPPPRDAKEAAVLVTLRESTSGLQTLLVTRGSSLRAHAGQVAFPGGAVEPADADVVATAVREATEETTLSSDQLQPVLSWPRLWIPVSGFAVTPVFAWWTSEDFAAARDANGEVVAVHHVGIEQLSDPRHRRLVRYPNGALGPGFDVDGLFVWGFTGLLIDRLLHFTGRELPWDATAVVDLPAAVASPPDSLGPALGRSR